ncbi:hypothetical protein ACR6HW_12860 [Fusibacter sp. JL298sf-3]
MPPRGDGSFVPESTNILQFRVHTTGAITGSPLLSHKVLPMLSSRYRNGANACLRLCDATRRPLRTCLLQHLGSEQPPYTGTKEPSPLSRCARGTVLLCRNPLIFYSLERTQPVQLPAVRFFLTKCCRRSVPDTAMGQMHACACATRHAIPLESA